ncbi:N-hydroxyarylamine O-acetyltransferase [Novosphingobium kunmingense]|uniref:N-hydroxyarylamine O-acetyltransferase n=1 Tax=Novosphingobium kunmingense TaxID=1211806 RepID=A0A2N0I430_9SPHN|nr:arylamine N-acetyltransferase [Novosphingobium kunmingense]PKB25944.1 N-hydroxyarylamine O-acetyltransferase [Novosphingobium kunmingense]
MSEALSPAMLDAYLQRIGHDGPLGADLSTLRALHRAHVLAIPFENLEVQFGGEPSMDPDAIFAKLVERRRGGWCYEQNGLFGRVLETLGFAVTRLAGGVMREMAGEQFVGNHLALKVVVDGDPWLCDVGFGSTQIEPLPLAEGPWTAAPLSGELQRTEDGYWRLAIIGGPMPLSFDFRDAPADEQRLQDLCAWQASDEQSIFVQNLAVQQRRPEGHAMLRGKVLTETTAAGIATHEIPSDAALVATLRDHFGLDVPEAAHLWPKIEERHAALFT